MTVGSIAPHEVWPIPPGSSREPLGVFGSNPDRTRCPPPSDDPRQGWFTRKSGVSGAAIARGSCRCSKIISEHQARSGYMASNAPTGRPVRREHTLYRWQGMEPIDPVSSMARQPRMVRLGRIPRTRPSNSPGNAGQASQPGRCAGVHQRGLTASWPAHSAISSKSAGMAATSSAGTRGSSGPRQVRDPGLSKGHRAHSVRQTAREGAADGIRIREVSRSRGSPS
jgi:hypothetical protein